MFCFVIFCMYIYIYTHIHTCNPKRRCWGNILLFLMRNMFTTAPGNNCPHLEIIVGNEECAKIDLGWHRTCWRCYFNVSLPILHPVHGLRPVWTFKADHEDVEDLENLPTFPATRSLENWRLLSVATSCFELLRVAAHRDPALVGLGFYCRESVFLRRRCHPMVQNWK